MHSLLNGIGCIEDEIGEDLVEFLRVDSQLRKIRIEIDLHLGNIAPSVLGNDDRRLNGRVEIGNRFFVSAWMGEDSHSSYDFHHSLDAVSHILDRIGNSVS